LQIQKKINELKFREIQKLNNEIIILIKINIIKNIKAVYIKKFWIKNKKILKILM